MKGLYEATLEANRGLRQQAVLETILGAVRRLLRSPGAMLTADAPGPGQLAAPMIVADRPQWLVASGRRRDEPFDDADRGLLQALAAVGSGALTNAELYQQVHVERETLSSITLNIGEGVCAIDAGGGLTFVNPAAADMIELPPLGIMIDDPVSDGAPAAPDFLLVPAREAMRTGRTVREDDARFRGKGGEVIPVAYTASAVVSTGRRRARSSPSAISPSARRSRTSSTTTPATTASPAWRTAGCWWTAWIRRCGGRCWTARPTP